jgi:hypothetical protein
MFVRAVRSVKFHKFGKVALALPLWLHQNHNYNQEQQKVQEQKVIHVREQLEHLRQNEKQKQEQEQEQQEKQKEKQVQKEKFHEQQMEVSKLKMKSARLIFALDFTGSSSELHSREYDNPYAEVIDILSQVMKHVPGSSSFDAFSFGENHTKVTPICGNLWDSKCTSFKDFQLKYQAKRANVGGGNSCLCSTVEETLRLIKEQPSQETLLVVITDGELEDYRDLRPLFGCFPFALYYVLVDSVSYGAITDLENSLDTAGTLDYYNEKIKATSAEPTKLQEAVAKNFAAFLSRVVPKMQAVIKQ